MKLIAALATISALVIGVIGSAAQEVKVAEGFVRPFPMVAMARGASEAQKAAAKEVADALGVAPVMELERNPVCCVWVEVTGWTPNPGGGGYVIINQGGGSIISASNEEQLRAAVARFKKSVRRNGGQVEVPAGVMTSYRVVAEAEGGR